MNLQFSDEFQIEDLGIQEIDVYDIETEDNHNFFGNDILVHNSVYFNVKPIVDKYLSGMEKPDIVKKLEKMAVDIIQREVNDIVQKCVCDSMNVHENKLNFKLEVVGDKSVWLAKKKYIVRAYSSEGVTYSKPKFKTIGVELVRSSTPMFIRKKLKELLPIIFDGNESGVQKFLKETRKEFDSLDIRDIAFPRSANDLEGYSDPNTVYKKGNGSGTPIAVRAALLYNNQIDKLGLVGKYAKIVSGAKIKFVYLKMPNSVRENVIGFPADEFLPPEFGLETKIDRDLQWEKTMIASTQIILDAIGWSAVEIATLDDFFS